METDKIIRLYNERLPLFERLQNEARRILAPHFEIRGIRLHHLGSRIKELDSLLEKTKRKKILDPFVDMTDIVGLRIVYLFQGDLEKIKEIIRESFRVIKEDDKIAKTPHDVFRYAAPHFDVRLPEQFDKEKIGKMTFEIQVPTISQDAWAAVSHCFYKEKNKVPSKLRRDFYALHGLFYVADTHFDMLRPYLPNVVPYQVAK